MTDDQSRPASVTGQQSAPLDTPDRYLHGAYHPNGHCPNGVCAEPRSACVRCAATGPFEPCCSSHDALMCHLCYRLTHFVEVCGCPTCLADGLPRILGERERWANR